MDGYRPPVNLLEQLLAQEWAAEQAEREARRPRKASKWDKKTFYQSKAWKALRYQALRANAERHAGQIRCEVCGRGKADGVKVFHCDHIKPLSTPEGWERRLDITNTQIMCDDDNLAKSNTDSINWREPEDGFE